MITDLLNKISLLVSDLIPYLSAIVPVIAFLIFLLSLFYCLHSVYKHPWLIGLPERDDAEEDENE